MTTYILTQISFLSTPVLGVIIQLGKGRMGKKPADKWNLTPQEAVRWQREWSGSVVQEDRVGRVRYVAGVDVGFEGDHNSISRAGIVILRYPELTPVDYAVARMPVVFPYIPGLLSFREIPVIMRAFRQIHIQPDVTIADGHGLAHPRRLGLASHLGLVLGQPTVGCAKSILVGTVVAPEDRPGEWAPLKDGDEVIGAALVTRVRTKPIYVSVGHLVSLEHAIDLVFSCCRGFRLPETTRFAHRAAGGEGIEVERPRGR